MNARATVTSLALVVLAAATAAYAYLVDRGSVSDSDRAGRRTDVFPSFRVAEVTRLEVGHAGESLVLERDADAGGASTWTMTSPRHEAADSAAVDMLLRELELATRLREVGANDAAGLETPRASGKIKVGKLEYRFALGGDARLIVRVPPLGNLSFRAEAVNAQNLDRGLEVADPVGAGHDLREVGYSGGATQELTRWAMVGARYDLYNPNGDASQQRAVSLVPVDRAYSTFALMGMARYRQARLLLEYDINRNPLGIGSNGAPTTLADNAVTLRGQLVF